MENWKDFEVNFADDFLSKTEHDVVQNYCLSAKFKYGEVDDYELDHPPTGMVHEIPETEFVYKMFRKHIHDRLKFTHEMKLYRMYVNIFAPNENPYFHQDGDGITFIYYPNKDYNMQWGGETQIVVDNNIHGVIPIPNRLLFFNGNLWHRATSFRDTHRFTVAIKYEPSK